MSKRKILFVLTCVIALLAVIPVTGAVSRDEVEPEAEAAAVASMPAEGTVSGEEGALHAEPIKGLPFSNFDLLAMGVVLAGFISLSFVVHVLNRDQGEGPGGPPITTDAE